MKKEEENFKVKFALKHFDIEKCDFNVLKDVDILLKDLKNNPIMYIAAKDHICNKNEFQKALAQLILTNKKQERILNTLGIIYCDEDNNDIFAVIDCSDDAVMYHNDINWKSEKPSNPTKDAIDRISDRLNGKIKFFINDEIKEIYKKILANKETIDITRNNFISIYNEWKNEIKFIEKITNEQELILLFLIDILNKTEYKNNIQDTFEEGSLSLNGTRLDMYEIRLNDKIEFVYKSNKHPQLWTISDIKKYKEFWNKYKRPPEKNEFKEIQEQNAKLFTDKYRRDTGAEYTPLCFVELQNQKLNELGYNLNEYIIFDPCCGVGNLENQFEKDCKDFCFLSTLEPFDVDICKSKGFDNSVQFDFLENNSYPQFKYKGQELDIREIAKLENKKLMIIMNPPYHKKKGIKENLAIEFFNKCVKLQPDVIILYYQTESFFTQKVTHYIKSNYKIRHHAISNAKTTFLLSEWAISQVIFDKNIGDDIKNGKINVDRYVLNKKTQKLDFIKSYTYDNSRPNLIKEIEKEIKKNATGIKLGSWCYLRNVIYFSNFKTKNILNSITTNNLKYCLLLKGLNFNDHAKYFERNNFCYRGVFEEITKELFNDAIMFSMFHKNGAFSNKSGFINYIMPFTYKELGCSPNDLNVLFNENYQLDTDNNEEKYFDFREFFKKFEFSQEAKDLYSAALEMFKYYHKSGLYKDTNYNDSFYDITNAIMGKNPNDFKTFKTENDTRIIRTRTTKGTKGFRRNTIKYVVQNQFFPIFTDFFDKKDVLAKKINKQLLDNNLLLWERETIY